MKKRTAEMLAERRAFYEHEKEIDESKKRLAMAEKELEAQMVEWEEWEKEYSEKLGRRVSIVIIIK